jgi:pimeloyl-ACP methyl ester carboxylesterase
MAGADLPCPPISHGWSRMNSNGAIILLQLIVSARMILSEKPAIFRDHALESAAVFEGSWLLIIAIWILAALIAAFVVYFGSFALLTRRIAADAERKVPPSGKFVDIEGNRIHYVEAGQGRPILFIHGLGAQLHQFRHTLFDRLESDFRLIALDRPGSGYSVSARGAGAGISEQARVIVDLMEKLGVERPLIVGHSLGGIIALAIAVEHPDRLSGLALLSPYTRYSEKTGPEFAPLKIAQPWRRWFIAQTTAIPDALKTAPQVLDFIFGPQAVPVDYPIAGGGMLGLRPSHFYATSSDLMASGLDMPRLAARYGEIKVPVAILFGTADRVLPHKPHGIAMKDKIPGLELELLDGIGHMPHFMATEAVAAFIRRMAAKAFALS